ncbi:hypothetical protein MH928_09820 [Flavobacterium sp. WW92]|uniref:response regulator n=1 Tax=unclassified Flavobacterium TaxID=196869 RepID=UPI0022257E1C|nr:MULTISPECIES: hypothetical protein [unclassified Flavobacterium]WDO11629.1 hypothetical protein MH928_09820 [Flavobacterium sp. WW92]
MIEASPVFENMMIIDDNNIDLYITTQTIKRNNIGKTVMPYSIAEDALKFLQLNALDLSALPRIILVDIYMPVMSGFEFMEAYDKLPAVLKEFCKVFIVSSSIDSVDLDRANKDPNVTAFREKPISVEFLQEISKLYPTEK